MEVTAELTSEGGGKLGTGGTSLPEMAQAEVLQLEEDQNETHHWGQSRIGQVRLEKEAGVTSHRDLRPPAALGAMES